MRFARCTLVAMALCLSAAIAAGGIILPGKHGGMVLFDRWGGCYLYQGIFVMYVSEQTKEKLREYDRKWVQVDAREVYQPLNPGDGRIGKYDILGPAPKSPEWLVVDGMKLISAAAFENGHGPRVAVRVRNTGKDKLTVFSGQFAITVLAKIEGNSRLFNPSDGPSFALITRQNFEIGGDTPRWRGEAIANGVPYAWTIGEHNALPHSFELAVGEQRMITVDLTLPPGEYEFIAGYAGYAGAGVASNSVAFDIAAPRP